MEKEVEIKVRVEDLKDVVKVLESKGIKLSEPIAQNDLTFVDEDYGDYDKLQTGKNILRIRENNGKYLFTLKQSLSNEQDAIERETEIGDPQIFKDALVYMGYKPMVEIRKIRRKAKYENYEICLDEVESLGSFVEIEKMTSGDSLEAQSEMIKLLGSLGITFTERVYRGYDTLIWLKNNPQ